MEFQQIPEVCCRWRRIVQVSITSNHLNLEKKLWHMQPNTARFYWNLGKMRSFFRFCSTHDRFCHNPESKKDSLHLPIIRASNDSIVLLLTREAEIYFHLKITDSLIVWNITYWASGRYVNRHPFDSHRYYLLSVNLSLQISLLRNRFCNPSA